MSILVDLCHTLNASKIIIIRFTHNNIYLNISMISSSVLNSGNAQCEWKFCIATAKNGACYLPFGHGRVSPHLFSINRLKY
jgi:hypothetical protein